jgi:UDP-2,4-diacetamido-2,4,6-trideoxy-beta-L-altropyranose hydrolase
VKRELLYFRCDAGPLVGSGHLMRSLALAQAWQDEGGRCVFLSAAPEPLLGRLRQEGHEVHQLESAFPDSADLNHVSQVITETPHTWLVLDGYHFDPAYQQALRDAGARLLVIDDTGHLPTYHADIILNQNLDAKNIQYSAPDSMKLLGTSFALLRREFAAWRAWQRPMPAKARKILVTMGGADPDNVTLKVIRALGRLPGDAWEAVVVIGAANPHQLSLNEASVECGFTLRFERAVRDMSSLMGWADLAISAAGSTCWELCFMGLPSVLVEFAANQTNLARALHERGAAINLGWHSKVEPKDLTECLSTLADDADRRTSLARIGRLLVDGRGSQRVVEALRSKCPTLLVRRAGHDDCRTIWEWANDMATRSASFSSDSIPWDEHVAWFTKTLSDPACHIYIVLDGCRCPVGTVRYDDHGSEAIVSINLAPTHRGRGLGSAVLRSTTRALFRESNVRKIVALVKPENRASVSVFERAGYVPSGKTRVAGLDALRLVFTKEER